MSEIVGTVPMHRASADISLENIISVAHRLTARGLKLHQDSDQAVGGGFFNVPSDPAAK